MFASGRSTGKADINARIDMLAAKADAARAAGEARPKSLFVRLRERLWPRRQAPNGDQRVSYGTFSDPGH